MKTPISWIIDDPAPVISVYHEHADSPFTADGRPLIPTYSNEGLFRFCRIIRRYGIRGKFSVVPMPGNKGDILSGLDGVHREEMEAWLSCVKEQVMGPFSIGPEMLTHHKAVDLTTGEALPMNEEEWSALQDRSTLIPYIRKALSLLQEAGFSTLGVTSPWTFGIAVEKEYEAAISAAVEQATGSKKAWFFLRGLRDLPNAKPWVAYENEGRILVSIPATTRDHLWHSIDCPRTDEEYVRSRADRLITEDGREGEILRVLNTGGFPILVTHWQSLMSNGLYTGLRIMDEVGRRIEARLSHRVQWMSFEEILDLVLSQKKDFPKPKF